MVHGLKAYAHYNGKCVQLYQLVNNGDVFKSPVSNEMWVHSTGSASWICTGDIINPNGGGNGWGSFNPRNLMPIDGHDVAEDEREEEVSHG